MTAARWPHRYQCRAETWPQQGMKGKYHDEYLDGRTDCCGDSSDRGGRGRRKSRGRKRRDSSSGIGLPSIGGASIDEHKRISRDRSVAGTSVADRESFRTRM